MSKQLRIKVNNDGHRQELILKAYSPGDGAFSLNCVYPDSPSGKPAPFLASDQDVMKLRDTQYPGMGILQVEDRRRYFRPVERISEDEVRLEGKTFRYEKKEGFDSNPLDPEMVRLFVDASQSASGEEVEIGNINLLSHVNFFLRNEEAIAECRNQFGNEEAFKYSLSGQAKQDRISGFNMTP